MRGRCATTDVRGLRLHARRGGTSRMSALNARRYCDPGLWLARTPDMIPPYTRHGILPPFLGDPTSPVGRSPFDATIDEVVGHFSTSSRRQAILAGFLGSVPPCARPA
jgi:hypothetical protein